MTSTTDHHPHRLSDDSRLHLAHPAAPVPDRLFADDADEERWRQRFSAVRMSLPEPADHVQDHAVYVSNSNGRYELYCWDIADDVHSIATSRPDGTVHGTVSADGSELLWFDDTDGDEFGRWQRQPFGSGPGSASPSMPTVPPGYPGGLEAGRGVIIAGFVDDDGTRIHLSAGGHEPQIVYRHANDASVDGLSRDETIWLLAHSEHGDSRYPALRAIAVADGEVLGALDDNPGKGLEAIAFSPIAGDQRVLVGHERRGHDQLLIWDIATGEVTELDIELPGDVYGEFYPDAESLLILQTNAGRTSMHRYRLSTGELTDLPAAPGVISGAITRPDGAVWYRWSSATHPGQLRVLAPDASTDQTLLLPPAARLPARSPSATCGSRDRADRFTRSSRGRRAGARPRWTIEPAPPCPPCSSCTAVRRRRTRIRTTPPALPGSMPDSSSCTSTTADRPATARPGAMH